MECLTLEVKEQIKESIENISDENLLWIIQDFINALIK